MLSAISPSLTVVRVEWAKAIWEHKQHFISLEIVKAKINTSDEDVSRTVTFLFYKNILMNPHKFLWEYLHLFESFYRSLH